MRNAQAAVASLLLVLIACGSPEPGGTVFGDVDPVEAVTGFDPEALDRSIHDLNGAALSIENVEPGLAELLRADDPTTRWAAVYVVALAAGPDDLATLMPALDDPDPANRVIAAGSLASLGHVPALAILVEAVGSNVLLPYHHPERPAAELALEALHAFIDLTEEDPAAWADWWSANRADLVWDGERYVTR